jgi:integrase
MRRLPGKPHPVRVVLGKYPSLSLAAARKQAGAALADLAAGIHPRERARALQAAEAQRKAVTVAHVVLDFTARHLSKKRTGHAVGQLLRRELVSRWGDRPITDINRADVIGMVEAIGDRSPSTARQTWLYTTRLFNWALSRDVYGLTTSPCERVRVADLIGSPKPRERVLDSGELRAIWQITSAGEFPFDPFVRLLLLLGCRRGELAGMRRDELDLAAGLWQLSGERTKNEQPRTIPLSKAAVAILAGLPVFPGPFVFVPPAARSLSRDFRGSSAASTAALRPSFQCRIGPFTIFAEPCERTFRRCRSAVSSPS